MTFEELLAVGGAWVWANYAKDAATILGKRVIGHAGVSIKKAFDFGWDRLEWELAARKYQKRLLDAYGTIRALGKSEPLPLEGIFTDVCILDRPNAVRRFDIVELRRNPNLLDQQSVRYDGLTLVNQPASRRLFILGKPGAGKTTFLKYLVLQAARGKIDKIPIFVSLRELAGSGLGLMGYIYKQFEICDFPDAEPFVVHLLKKGDFIVLFDGLDEVNQEERHREQTVESIRDFSRQHFHTQCIVTCRVAATEYQFEDFTYVEMADFTAAQIDSFVTKWFAQEPEKLKLFKEAFDRRDNWRLRDLARTPLLLTLLCLSFSETMTFPARRAEIYEEALDALLKKWDASRAIQRDEIYRGLTPGRKRQMLARIAAQSFQLNEYFIPQAQLAKRLTAYLRQLPECPTVDEEDGAAVLQALEAQHGILVERAHRVFSFSHLTLQEYFTARYICEHATVRVLDQLLNLRHIMDRRWREVILLTSSLMENADEFFRAFGDSIKRLVNGDPALVNLIESSRSNDIVDQGRSKGVLYSCATARLALNLSSEAEYFLAQSAVNALRQLGVEFPLPEYVRVEASWTGRELVLPGLGPRRLGSQALSDDLDLTLIYAATLLERVVGLTVLELGSDWSFVQNRVRIYLTSLSPLINSTGDAQLAKEWQRVMPMLCDLPFLDWAQKIQPLIRQREIGNWEMNEAQAGKLENYIYASELMTNCLAQAVVTSRADIVAWL